MDSAELVTGVVAFVALGGLIGGGLVVARALVWLLWRHENDE